MRCFISKMDTRKTVTVHIPSATEIFASYGFGKGPSAELMSGDEKPLSGSKIDIISKVDKLAFEKD